MRILIVTPFFPPTNASPSHRPYSFAKYWKEAGHEVAILTPPSLPDPSSDLQLPVQDMCLLPTEPIQWLRRLKGTYREKSATTPTFLMRSFHALRERTGILKTMRLPDWTDLWVPRALRVAREQGPWDWAVTTGPPLSMHRIGASLKKSQHAKCWIADYRDTIIDNPAYPGLFPLNLIERQLEKRFIKQADWITVVSQGESHSLAARYGTERLRIIENGCDSNDYRTIKETSFFPQDGKWRIAHLGTIVPGKRDPSALFAAVQLLAQNRALSPLLERLEILFAGPQLGNLAELIDRYRVAPWVKCLGFVTREAALHIQRDAHLLLFLPWTDEKYTGILTGKLFEYLHSGTWMWSIGRSAIDEAQALILEAQAGEVLGTDVPKIAERLIQELQQGDKKSYSKNEALLFKHSRVNRAYQMLALMEGK